LRFLPALLLTLVIQAHAAIPAFCPVTAGIYRGGRPTAQDLLELKNLGVQTIVSLQGGDYAGNPVWGPFIPLFEPGETPAELAEAKAAAEALGLRYFNFPINSLKAISPSDALMISEILATMNEDNHQPLFVHCAKGVDRTGMIVALYRITYEGWSARDAYAEMVEKGHNLLHRAFTYELDRFFFKYARELESAGCEVKLTNSAATRSGL
jgi:protein tyrosine/serine phosphatase